MANGKSKEGGGARPEGGSDEARAGDARAGACRVLAVESDTQSRAVIERSLKKLGVACDFAGSLADARRAHQRNKYDVVVIGEEQRDGSGYDLLRESADAGDAARFIIISERPALEGAVEAMRGGAVDFISKPLSSGDFGSRIRRALELAQRLRDDRRRVDRLKRMCKRLDHARRDVSKQVDVLCNDLVSAYQELAQQMGSVSMASEFSTLVRNELDVEALLRTTLEFLLTKTGPTNAAIFLPTGSQDYSLGAYVNYDIPRESADVQLDYLADVLPERLESETDVRRYATSAEFIETLGENAALLNNCGVVTFACREDGECLAVVALFRDRSQPFPDEVLPALAIIRDVFGEQLARVVRVHHRHRPKDTWRGFDVEDDRGLAA